MRHRYYKLITLFLALILAGSSCIPVSAWAEAQMRCAGASPQSLPCAQAELSAAGLTERQVYATLMSCCRSRQGGCTLMRGCALGQRAQRTAKNSHAALSARHCLMSVRAIPVPTPLAARRACWFLAAAPAFAPPMPAPVLTAPAVSRGDTFWTFSPGLSLHSLPFLHGLRAPPAV